jgi:DNA-binding NarL/FixJ family response regulator
MAVHALLDHARRPMLGVAVLDDHPAVLAGLRRLLETEPELTVLAAAPSARELARQLAGRRPDVLVLDHRLAAGDGLARCRRIKDRPQPPAVIIYSAYASPALTLAARAARADGVVDKAAPVPALLAAIREVARGKTVFPALPRDVYEAAVARLDDEDLPVLAMLLEGELLDAIAQALRTDRTEIAWRTQRIIGRLGTGVRTPFDQPAIQAGHTHDPSLGASS